MGDRQPPIGAGRPCGSMPRATRRRERTRGSTMPSVTGEVALAPPEVEDGRGEGEAGIAAWVRSWRAHGPAEVAGRSKGAHGALVIARVWQAGPPGWQEWPEREDSTRAAREGQSDDEIASGRQAVIYLPRADAPRLEGAVARHEEGPWSLRGREEPRWPRASTRSSSWSARARTHGRPPSRPRSRQLRNRCETCGSPKSSSWMSRSRTARSPPTGRASTSRSSTRGRTEPPVSSPPLPNDLSPWSPAGSGRQRRGAPGGNRHRIPNADLPNRLLSFLHPHSPGGAGKLVAPGAPDAGDPGAGRPDRAPSAKPAPFSRPYGDGYLGDQRDLPGPRL